MVREMLENYMNYKADIKKIERDILKLKEEEIGVNGSNFEINGDIRPSGYVSCNIENKIINNADKIKSLELKKSRLQAEIDYIDSLINTLEDDDRKVIELRYKYNKLPRQIGKITYKDKSTINKALKRILHILENKHISSDVPQNCLT